MHEFVWLTLEEDGTFFLRHGDWLWGPWHKGWRGRWEGTESLLILSVEEKDTGRRRSPSDGRFICCVEAGSIRLPEFKEGEQIPPNAAVCEYRLYRDAEPR